MSCPHSLVVLPVRAFGRVFFQGSLAELGRRVLYATVSDCPPLANL